jgi:chromosome segregation ATPase
MNRVEGKENRPSILQHVDVSVMQAMLREKEGELAVWREDAGAKGRELIRALELLQAAQTRESELRCQAANLTGQLMIMQDALMQSEVDLDDLEQQIAELNGNSETVNSMTQLAQARADAERYASRAAALESALLESERRVQELEAKAGRLQSFISGPAILQHQTFDRYEELECFAGKQAGELVESQPTQPDFASRPGVVLCVARTVLLPRVCAAVLAALTRAMRER